MSNAELDATAGAMELEDSISPHAATSTASPQRDRDFWKHHTIHIHYPALDLLPRGREPYIEFPKNMGDRLKPQFHTLGLQPDDIEFFVRLPARYGPSDSLENWKCKEPAARTPSEGGAELLASIARLSQRTGWSDLRVVSYVLDDDVYTRFSLSAEYATSGGMYEEPTYQFVLDSVELVGLLRRSDDWVVLLADLIHSKSDRAYLAMRNRVDQWDPEYMDNRETFSFEFWDVNPLRTAKEVLKDRLRDAYALATGEVGPLDDLEALGNETLELWLPCGHNTHVEADDISSMSVRDILKATCQACGRKVLTQQDEEALKCYYDRVKRYVLHADNLEWEAYSKPVRDSSSLIEITGPALLQALEDSLESLSLLPSITPKLLNPTEYYETLYLMAKFDELLEANEDIPIMTPKILFTHLEGLAEAILTETVSNAEVLDLTLPPGFDSFLDRWLKRAVNSAVANAKAEKFDTTGDALAELTDMLGATKLEAAGKVHAEAVGDAGLEDIMNMLAETKIEEEEEEEQAEPVTRGRSPSAWGCTSADEAQLQMSSGEGLTVECLEDDDEEV